MSLELNTSSHRRVFDRLCKGPSGDRYRCVRTILCTILCKSLCAPAAISFAFLAAGPARGDEPRLVVWTTQVLLPLGSEEAMNAGRVEADPSRGSYAVQIDVDADGTNGGWVLYLRAEQATFTPESGGKPCTDVLWKLDEENHGAYRRLNDDEVVVLENPSGGSARILLDLSVDLDWDTDPGTYGLGLVFRIAGL
jgi:hypothetical protein